MNRRDFLIYSASALTSCALPSTAIGANQSNPKYLLLVELNGGNDGLNTIIPFRDPNYKKLRPTMGLRSNEIIHLTDKLGMHKALAPLNEIWKGNQMGVINGVGYAEPNRSHFRSIEIWDTASNSEEYLDNGWLSRVIPGKVQHDSYLVDGIVIGRNSAPANGNNMRTIVMNTIADFAQQSKQIESKKNTTSNPALKHILNTQKDIKSAANAMDGMLHNSNMKIPGFKGGGFGKQLREAAKLIINQTAAPVIKVSIGGFDTHANQKGVHNRILGQFALGIKSFSDVMRSHNHWDDVIIMTYSEFGRRAKQNASQGTDHGTAAPHFMIGGRVKGGMYGEQPSLTDLQDNDLKFNVDYRSLYNTIAKNWWGNSKGINSTSYPAIELIS